MLNHCLLQMRTVFRFSFAPVQTKIWRFLVDAQQVTWEKTWSRRELKSKIHFKMCRIHCSSITWICKWHLSNLPYNISLLSRHTNGPDRLFGYLSYSLDFHFSFANRDYDHLLALSVLHFWLWVKLVSTAHLFCLRRLVLPLTLFWQYKQKVFSNLQQGATWYRKCFICLIPFLLLWIFSVDMEALTSRF